MFWYGMVNINKVYLDNVITEIIRPFIELPVATLTAAFKYFSVPYNL